MTWVPKSRLARSLGLVAFLLLFFMSVILLQRVSQPRRPAWVEFVESRPPIVNGVVPASTTTAHGDFYTVTYDVRDLVDYAARPVTAVHRGKKIGPREIDDVVNLIVQVVSGPWTSGRSSSTIDEINGTHLEIHTSRKNHREIEDLLDALRRLDDVAVMVDSQLYEVDRTFYDQVIEPELNHAPVVQGKRCGSAISPAVASQIDSEGIKTKHGTALVIPNGETAKLFSIRRVLLGTAYALSGTNPAVSTPVNWAAPKNASFTGVTVKGTPVVAPDRRSVFLTLEQEIWEQDGTRKREINAPMAKNIIVEQPNIVQSSLTASFQVMDGGVAVVPIHYPATGQPGRTLLLMIQPTLYLEGEEKALREQERTLPKPLEWLKSLTTP